MRLRIGAALAMAAVLALAGCGGEDTGSQGAGLKVQSAYMPQPVTAAMAAGYLVIENDSDAPDTLRSVTSDIAQDVTIHTTSGQTMESAGSADRAIPAHGRLVLESGGMHLMFEKLKRKPKEGETVSVELHFAKTDPVKVEMPVKSATYQPASTTSTKSSASSSFSPFSSLSFSSLSFASLAFSSSSSTSSAASSSSSHH
ncbi:copper chaperone PCu(A)C [Streptomyces sp. KM273126]|uniref:copper chaperone PCu(A)C n=1 Tax=Streptomyces sp. KM273126 TaxID=2545247 RepID=UPI0015EBEBD1|nr:copper chaperone PCu(A)C [Streptomyces sp. KM273126]MBA2807454.1 copper chaperone PCu(A)C [Streptomyces sp. KM273126]